MYSLTVSGSQGSRRGSAEWFKLTGMVVGRFHFLAGSRGPSTGLPECPQDMAANFPPQ